MRWQPACAPRGVARLTHVLWVMVLSLWMAICPSLQAAPPAIYGRSQLESPRVAQNGTLPLNRPSQAPSNGSPLTGVLEGLISRPPGKAEALPPPIANTPPAGSAPRPSARQGFTIPLANAGDKGAIEISNDEGLISLVVRDAPLRHVLAMLADAHQLNLVFASSTDVPVTASFDKVPLQEALNSLLTASGFTWSLNGNVIYVTSVTEANGISPIAQGRRVRVFELDFASSADLDQAVKGLLSPVGQSWIMEASESDNRRTREAIVVEDIPTYIDRIEQYIAEADQTPRQVMIEAKILEIDLDKNKRAGVDLSGLARLSGARFAAGSAGLANIANTPAFFISNNSTDLSLLVEALITQTDAKTLASPRLIAVNGQQSRIQIGEQLGFRVTTTTQTSTLESVDFLDVGVVLTVTPRITRDGRVLMRIKPEVSSGVVNTTTGLPEEETTEVETDALLNSGQAMVIGGLIQERDSTVVSKVPVLGSIPYAGFFFQRRTEEKRRSEIIVALVPHVLPYEPVLQQRNDNEVARSFEPLLHGPLCRYPRPYEPRLPDTIPKHKPLLRDPGEPCCPPTGPCYGPQGPHAASRPFNPNEYAAVPRDVIRRLPAPAVAKPPAKTAGKYRPPLRY